MDHERWEKLKTENPELRAHYLQKMKEYIIKREQREPGYMEKKRTISNERNKIRYKNDPEYREKTNRYHAEWVKKNPELAKESQKRSWEKHAAEYTENRNRKKICKILMDHGEMLREDPEHLPTDFIISLINRENKVKC